MRGEEWTATSYDFTPVSFKSIRNIVRFDAKKHADKKVGAAVYPEFQPGVIDNAAAFDKTTAKDAIVARVKDFPVTHDITAIIGFISHHHNNGIAAGVIEAANDSTTESVCVGVLNWSQSFNSPSSFSQNIPSIIGAAVVNNNDFMGNIVEAEFDVKMLHRRGDALGFIAGRNYDAQELQWLLLGWGIGHNGEERSNQPGLRSACLAISSRMDGRSRLGRQSSSPVVCALSITSQGTSKARGVGSGSIECFPKRFAHQSVSWASDIALVAPPPTLKIRGSLSGECSNCNETSSARSSG